MEDSGSSAGPSLVIDVPGMDLGGSSCHHEDCQEEEECCRVKSFFENCHSSEVSMGESHNLEKRVAACDLQVAEVHTTSQDVEEVRYRPIVEDITNDSCPLYDDLHSKGMPGAELNAPGDHPLQQPDKNSLQYYLYSDNAMDLPPVTGTPVWAESDSKPSLADNTKPVSASSGMASSLNRKNSVFASIGPSNHSPSASHLSASKKLPQSSSPLKSPKGWRDNLKKYMQSPLKSPISRKLQRLQTPSLREVASDRTFLQDKEQSWSDGEVDKLEESSNLSALDLYTDLMEESMNQKQEQQQAIEQSESAVKALNGMKEEMAELERQLERKEKEVQKVMTQNRILQQNISAVIRTAQLEMKSKNREILSLELRLKNGGNEELLRRVVPYQPYTGKDSEKDEGKGSVGSVQRNWDKTSEKESSHRHGLGKRQLIDEGENGNGKQKRRRLTEDIKNEASEVLRYIQSAVSYREERKARDKGGKSDTVSNRCNDRLNRNTSGKLSDSKPSSERTSSLTEDQYPLCQTERIENLVLDSQNTVNAERESKYGSRDYERNSITTSEMNQIESSSKNSKVNTVKDVARQNSGSELQTRISQCCSHDCLCGDNCNCSLNEGTHVCVSNGEIKNVDSVSGQRIHGAQTNELLKLDEERSELSEAVAPRNYQSKSMEGESQSSGDEKFKSSSRNSKHHTQTHRESVTERHYRKSKTSSESAAGKRRGFEPKYFDVYGYRIQRDSKLKGSKETPSRKSNFEKHSSQSKLASDRRRYCRYAIDESVVSESKKISRNASAGSESLGGLEMVKEMSLGITNARSAVQKETSVCDKIVKDEYKAKHEADSDVPESSNSNSDRDCEVFRDEQQSGLPKTKSVIGPSRSRDSREHEQKHNDGNLSEKSRRSRPRRYLHRSSEERKSRHDDPVRSKKEYRGESNDIFEGEIEDHGHEVRKVAINDSGKYQESSHTSRFREGAPERRAKRHGMNARRPRSQKDLYSSTEKGMCRHDDPEESKKQYSGESNDISGGEIENETHNKRYEVRKRDNRRSTSKIKEQTRSRSCSSEKSVHDRQRQKHDHESRSNSRDCSLGRKYETDVVCKSKKDGKENRDDLKENSAERLQENSPQSSKRDQCRMEERHITRGHSPKIRHSNKGKASTCKRGFSLRHHPTAREKWSSRDVVRQEKGDRGGQCSTKDYSPHMKDDAHLSSKGLSLGRPTAKPREDNERRSRSSNLTSRRDKRRKHSRSGSRDRLSRSECSSRKGKEYSRSREVSSKRRKNEVEKAGSQKRYKSQRESRSRSNDNVSRRRKLKHCLSKNERCEYSRSRSSSWERSSRGKRDPEQMKKRVDKDSHDSRSERMDEILTDTEKVIGEDKEDILGSRSGDLPEKWESSDSDGESVRGQSRSSSDLILRETNNTAHYGESANSPRSCSSERTADSESEEELDYYDTDSDENCRTEKNSSRFKSSYTDDYDKDMNKSSKVEAGINEEFLETERRGNGDRGMTFQTQTQGYMDDGEHKYEADDIEEGKEEMASGSHNTRKLNSEDSKPLGEMVPQSEREYSEEEKQLELIISNNQQAISLKVDEHSQGCLSESASQICNKDLLPEMQTSTDPSNDSPEAEDPQTAADEEKVHPVSPVSNSKQGYGDKCSKDKKQDSVVPEKPSSFMEKVQDLHDHGASVFDDVEPITSTSRLDSLKESSMMEEGPFLHSSQDMSKTKDTEAERRLQHGLSQNDKSEETKTFIQTGQKSEDCKDIQEVHHCDAGQSNAGNDLQEEKIPAKDVNSTRTLESAKDPATQVNVQLEVLPGATEDLSTIREDSGKVISFDTSIKSTEIGRLPSDFRISPDSGEELETSIKPVATHESPNGVIVRLKDAPDVEDVSILHQNDDMGVSFDTSIKSTGSGHLLSDLRMSSDTGEEVESPLNPEATSESAKEMKASNEDDQGVEKDASISHKPDEEGTSFEASLMSTESGHLLSDLRMSSDAGEEVESSVDHADINESLKETKLSSEVGHYVKEYINVKLDEDVYLDASMKSKVSSHQLSDTGEDDDQIHSMTEEAACHESSISMESCRNKVVGDLSSIDSSNLGAVRPVAHISVHSDVSTEENDLVSNRPLKSENVDPALESLKSKSVSILHVSQAVAWGPKKEWTKKLVSGSQRKPEEMTDDTRDECDIEDTDQMDLKETLPVGNEKRANIVKVGTNAVTETSREDIMSSLDQLKSNHIVKNGSKLSSAVDTQLRKAKGENFVNSVECETVSNNCSTAADDIKCKEVNNSLDFDVTDEAKIVTKGSLKKNEQVNEKDSQIETNSSKSDPALPTADVSPGSGDLVRLLQVEPSELTTNPSLTDQAGEACEQYSTPLKGACTYEEGHTIISCGKPFTKIMRSNSIPEQEARDQVDSIDIYISDSSLMETPEKCKKDLFREKDYSEKMIECTSTPLSPLKNYTIPKKKRKVVDAGENFIEEFASKVSDSMADTEPASSHITKYSKTKTVTSSDAKQGLRSVQRRKSGTSDYRESEIKKDKRERRRNSSNELQTHSVDQKRERNDLRKLLESRQRGKSDRRENGRGHQDRPDDECRRRNVRQDAESREVGRRYYKKRHKDLSDDVVNPKSFDRIGKEVREGKEKDFREEKGETESDQRILSQKQAEDLSEGEIVSSSEDDMAPQQASNQEEKRQRDVTKKESRRRKCSPQDRERKRPRRDHRTNKYRESYSRR